MQPHQQTLFRTTKERESKINQIERQNRLAARIILSDAKYAGGLMEQWAQLVLSPRGLSPNEPERPL
jgi:hypothetical protein